MNAETVELQRRLAANAGNNPDGEPWASCYDYHLSMIDPPLMFGLFKIKATRLDGMLKADPDGKSRSMDREINRLCRELGY